VEEDERQVQAACTQRHQTAVEKAWGEALLGAEG